MVLTEAKKFMVVVIGGPEFMVGGSLDAMKIMLHRLFVRLACEAILLSILDISFLYFGCLVTCNGGLSKRGW
jgi:hypothetical protein